MPFCLDAKYAETAVVVVEGDALHDAGDFLGRGSALWDCSVHSWGFILPRMDGAWVIPQEGDSEGGLWGGVQVESNVSEALEAFVTTPAGS
jgi:hypothetical protein